jgi:hypothetical protein
VADFWWKVCCTGEGEVKLWVEATSSRPTPLACGLGGAPFEGKSEEVTVKQVLPECEPCLVVDIIECPEEVSPSNVFGVKAKIHNVCDNLTCGVAATIKIESYGDQGGTASRLPGYPATLNVGCIYPGRYEEVGWTLHCDTGGDVKITIDAECDPPHDCGCHPCGPCDDPCAPEPEPDPCEGRCEVQSDYCIVHQICPADLTVEITDIPDKVCEECDNCFEVTAEVCDPCGDTDVSSVQATLNIIKGDV